MKLLYILNNAQVRNYSINKLIIIHKHLLEMVGHVKNVKQIIHIQIRMVLFIQVIPKVYVEIHLILMNGNVCILAHLLMKERKC